MPWPMYSKAWAWVGNFLCWALRWDSLEDDKCSSVEYRKALDSPFKPLDLGFAFIPVADKTFGLAGTDAPNVDSDQLARRYRHRV